MAVTITGASEVDCNPGIQNAKNLAALTDNPDIPVAYGRETAPQRSDTFPQARDAMDSMISLTLRPI